MPIHKKDATKLIQTHFDRLSNDIRSYNEIVSKLAKEEDDWSFVIKTHAFIEMFISEYLVKHIGDEKLERLVQRLPLSDSTIGKLSICKDLELLGKPQRKFVRFYSELRNKLAHRFEDVSFCFSEHVNSLTNPQIKKWQSSLIWFPVDSKSKQIWNKIAIENPRTAIWVGIVIMASVFNIDSSHRIVKRNIDKLALDTSEKLLSELTEN